MGAATAQVCVTNRKPELEEKLRDALGIGPLIAIALVNRGYETPEAASAFMNPSLDDLGDPALLPDFAAGVECILSAKERGERLFVHGDYDVDGVSSASLFARFLRKIGCDVDVHVPHRISEGYGIHESAVEMAAKLGAKVFVTADCGTGAVRQVTMAREAGMRVVVTDHHAIPSELAPADALINPHRSNSHYPFESLCGAGVAFRFCEGLAREIGLSVDSFRRAYLDLVTLGTVADLMPLIGENRAIVRHGLPFVQSTKKVGLRAIVDLTMRSPQRRPMSAHDVGFRIAPRLNAAGRIDDAALALRLLMEADEQEAKQIAERLDELNTLRREKQDEAMRSAVERLECDGIEGRYVLFAHSEEWHPGIIGLVAGRLVESYGRPAFAVTVVDGVARGSGRSIPGFNLSNAIHRHADLLLAGGGHAEAAGITFEPDRLPELVESMNRYAAEFLTPADFVRRITVDADLAGDEVSEASVAELSLLEPTGQSNPQPVFALRGATLLESIPTKNPDHRRAVLRSRSGATLQAIAFGWGEDLGAVPHGTVGDAVVTLQIDEYRGMPEAKAVLKWFGAQEAY